MSERGDPGRAVHADDGEGHALCGTFGFGNVIAEDADDVTCRKCRRRLVGKPGVAGPADRLAAAHALIAVLWQRQLPEWTGWSWEDPDTPPEDWATGRGDERIGPDELRELRAALAKEAA